MAAETRRNKVARATRQGGSDGMSDGALVSDMFAVDQRVVVEFEFWGSCLVYLR
jgi:hypothetical protein